MNIVQVMPAPPTRPPPAMVGSTARAQVIPYSAASSHRGSAKPSRGGEDGSRPSRGEEQLATRRVNCAPLPLHLPARCLVVGQLCGSKNGACAVTLLSRLILHTTGSTEHTAARATGRPFSAVQGPAAPGAASPIVNPTGTFSRHQLSPAPFAPQAHAFTVVGQVSSS